MATSSAPSELFQRPSKLVVPTVRHFYLYFHRRNVAQPIAGMWLSRPYNPLRPKIIHAYQERERGILWWGVGSGNIVSYKRTVRSYCARRVRRAFAEALRDRGFDTAGRRLVFDSEGNITERGKCLKGTLDLRMNSNLLSAEYSSILLDARAVVDHLRGFQPQPSKRPT